MIWKKQLRRKKKLFPAMQSKPKQQHSKFNSSTRDCDVSKEKQFRASWSTPLCVFFGSLFLFLNACLYWNEDYVLWHIRLQCTTLCWLSDHYITSNGRMFVVFCLVRFKTPKSRYGWFFDIWDKMHNHFVLPTSLSVWKIKKIAS